MKRKSVCQLIIRKMENKNENQITTVQWYVLLSYNLVTRFLDLALDLLFYREITTIINTFKVMMMKKLML